MLFRSEVRVLEPIDTRGMTEADIPALRDRVRGLIKNEISAMRAAA